MIGFTGTRDGMTPQQRAAVTKILERYCSRFGALVGHGDCLGADAEFDEIAASLGIQRATYPCDIESMRAHCEVRGALQVTEPVGPLLRNGWIVRDALAMIATPKESTEQLRSGTWATVRLARRKIGLPLLLVAPNGNLL
jgi:hypothetical protein